MPTIKTNPWVWMLPALVPGAADDASDSPTPEPPSVLKDFTEVRSFREDGPPLFRVWRKADTPELILELSPDTEGKPLFVVPTVAAGDPEAGVYSVFHRAVQRQAQHVCTRCGYDLRGNMESANCPECGAPPVSRGTKQRRPGRLALGVLFVSVPVFMFLFTQWVLLFGVD